MSAEKTVALAKLAGLNVYAQDDCAFIKFSDKEMFGGSPFAPWLSADDCFLLADALMDAGEIADYKLGRVYVNGTKCWAEVWEGGGIRVPDGKTTPGDTPAAALFDALCAALLGDAQ